MKKILLLGSRGFIGSYLSDEFKEDKDIELYHGHSFKIKLEDTNSFEDAYKQIQPDVIINLAGFAHLDDLSIREIYELNCFSIIRIIDFLESVSFKGKFINTSSALVYGLKTNSIITENQKLNPFHTYACAKSAVDLLIASNEKKHINCLSARLFNCVGKGHRNNYLIPKIIKSFLAKERVINLGNTEIIRDFIDVRDVARAYALLSKTDTPFNTVNISSGKGIEIRKILDLLTKITDHEPEIIFDKSLVRENDNEMMVGSNDRLKSVGFHQKYSLEDTLKWMLSN